MQERKLSFILIYVWLQSADLAVQRVARRVSSGCHNIPEDVIRRRYERGRTNFFSLYKDMADVWSVIDNSGPSAIEVALFEEGQQEIWQLATWQLISQEQTP